MPATNAKKQENICPPCQGVFTQLMSNITLLEFSSILQDSIREDDTAARYRGDEFALILCESGVEGARDPTQRIIERKKMHLFPLLITFPDE
jgi:GGDEF domain-containing protein